MPFKPQLALALAALLAFTWSGAARGQQLPLRYLTQQDGLGNLQINTLVQDHTGYVWVGTENGLYRYNGAEFRRFGQAEGLASTQISALLADRRQRLWVAAAETLYLRVGDRLVPVKSAGRDFWIAPGPSASGWPTGRAAACWR